MEFRDSSDYRVFNHMRAFETSWFACHVVRVVGRLFALRCVIYQQKNFGFSGDIANGVVTPILSLLLIGTITIPFVPVRFVGILGILLF